MVKKKPVAQKRGDQERPKSRPTGPVRAIQVGRGIPQLPALVRELQGYTDVLLGRVDPPARNGVMTLMEIADAYYARASELTMLLQQAEREGVVLKGSAHYKFRTGELRTFMDMAKRAADLGSRRVTHEQLRMDAEKFGRGHLDFDIE